MLLEQKVLLQKKEQEGKLNLDFFYFFIFLLQYLKTIEISDFALKFNKSLKNNTK